MEKWQEIAKEIRELVIENNDLKHKVNTLTLMNEYELKRNRKMEVLLNEYNRISSKK